MKTYKKIVVTIGIFCIAVVTSAFSKNMEYDKSNNIVSRVMHYANQVSCNQYIKNSNEYFFKVCPKKYREVDIYYSVDKKIWVSVYSPVTKPVFMTRYGLKSFFQSGGFGNALNLTKDQLDKTMKNIRIINKSTDYYDITLDMDIKYSFVILENFDLGDIPKEEFFQALKELSELFGVIATQDDNFSLTDAKSEQKRYFPKKYWIYDRVDKAYYVNHFEDELDYIKFTISPMMSFQFYNIKSDDVRKAIDLNIKELNKIIKKVIDDNNIITIYFKYRFSKEQIENLVQSWANYDEGSISITH